MKKVLIIAGIIIAVISFIVFMKSDKGKLYGYGRDIVSQRCKNTNRRLVDFDYPEIEQITEKTYHIYGECEVSSGFNTFESDYSVILTLTDDGYKNEACNIDGVLYEYTIEGGNVVALNGGYIINAFDE